MNMGNGVIMIPHHNFKQPSSWYQRVWEVKKYAFGKDTCGMKSVLNFIKILTEIIQSPDVHIVNVFSFPLHRTCLVQQCPVLDLYLVVYNSTRVGILINHSLFKTLVLRATVRLKTKLLTPQYHG
jgi:hypothetical protein